MNGRLYRSSYIDSRQADRPIELPCTNSLTGWWSPGRHLSALRVELQVAAVASNCCSHLFNGWISTDLASDAVGEPELLGSVEGQSEGRARPLPVVRQFQ